MTKQHQLIEEGNGFKLRLSINVEVIVYGTYLSRVDDHWLVYGCPYPKITEGRDRVVGVAHSRDEAMEKAYKHIRKESGNYDFTDKTGRDKESPLASKIS